MQLNPGYCRCSLLYLTISLFVFFFYSTGEPHGLRQARGCHHHIQQPVEPETAARAWSLPLIDKEVTPKNNGCIFYSSQYVSFPYFSFRFRHDKDANHLLSSNLPGHRLPTHSDAAAAPPISRPPKITIGTLNIWDGGAAD